MKKVFYVMLAVLLASTVSMNAQVTIGSTEDPHDGAVLELKSADKGLLLPRVKLDAADKWTIEGKAIGGDPINGMIVFNTGTALDEGLYVWVNGKWININGNGSGTGGGGGDGNGTGDIGTGSITIPTIPNTGGDADVTLTTDCTTPGEWTIVKESGVGTLSDVDKSAGSFKLTLPENTTASPRSTVIVVTDPCGYSKKLTFPQAPKAVDATAVVNGLGTFSGLMTFDIAASNHEQNACGSTYARVARRTDFKIRDEQDRHKVSETAPFSGVQVYTFTPSKTTYNLRFAYLEEGAAQGLVIESLTPKADYSGALTTAAKVSVAFKKDLGKSLIGLTRQNALKVQLYAIFSYSPAEGAEEFTIPLTLSFQDCTACGANSSSGWLEFMCYNLGADQTEDPFTSSAKTYGDWYQWGRKTDGHEKRGSGKAAMATTGDLDDNGQVKTTSKVGKFLTSSASPYDWRSPQDNKLWGATKTVSDPCPTGWKVPTNAQWNDVLSKNSTKKWETIGGYSLGEALFLPAAGIRPYDGTTNGVGTHGYYWSSTISSTNSYYLNFHSGGIYSNYNYRATGCSVRCVQE